MPKSKRWTNHSFSISVEDDETLYPEIVKIAKREGVSVSAVVVRALREYWKEHRKGNYQHYMENFMPDGVQSNRQIEQQIVDYFVDRFDKSFDVKYPNVVERVRTELRYDGQKMVDAVDRIVKQLHGVGVKIWR